MPKIAADIVSCEDGRIIARCDIANLAGIPQKFALTCIELRADNAVDARITNARVMIKDIARGLNSVADKDMLLDVDVTGLAPPSCADGEIEGLELCGRTRVISCDEFVEESRVLEIIIDSRDTLILRDVAFTMVEAAAGAAGRKARKRA